MNPTEIELIGTRWRGLFSKRHKTASQFPGVEWVRLSQGVARICRAGDPQKPVLVLLPDPPVVIEHYAEALQMLGQHFQVVLIELPGIGYSKPDWGFRFSIAGVGSALAELLQVLNLQRVILAGTCLGGYAIQHAANVAKDRVEKVVFLQTPCWHDGQQWINGRDPKFLLRRPVIGQLLFQLAKRKRLPAWFQISLANTDNAEQMSQTALHALQHGACFCLSSLFQDFLSPRQALPAPVAQPVMAICGTSDRSHRMTDWSRVRELGQSVEVSEWKDCGHFPDLEHSQRFVHSLLQFNS